MGDGGGRDGTAEEPPGGAAIWRSPAAGKLKKEQTFFYFSNSNQRGSSVEKIRDETKRKRQVVVGVDAKMKKKVYFM